MARPIFALYHLKHDESDRDAQAIFDPELGTLSLYVLPGETKRRQIRAGARLTAEDRRRLAAALLQGLDDGLAPKVALGDERDLDQEDTEPDEDEQEIIDSEAEKHMARLARALGGGPGGG